MPKLEAIKSVLPDKVKFDVRPVPINWHPDLSIYAAEKFLRAVSDDYGWLGGFDQTGDLRFVLPFTIIRKSFFRLVRFRVETISANGTQTPNEEKSFLNAAIEYLRSIGTDLVIPASTNTIFRAYPDGAVVAPYGTYQIDLTQEEENLFKNLNSSHRRKVRLAMKGGVEISSGIEHARTAYMLVRDTFKRSSLGFMGYPAFEQLVTSLGENIRILIAEHLGRVQGCVVVPFSMHSAYYVYGGSLPEPAPGAMNLLHWEAIRLFRKLGVRRYDFVGTRLDPEKGSKQEGLKTFKERFGGKLICGYMWKYSFNPMKYAVYQSWIRLRRGGDIVDQEKHKLQPGHPR